MIQICLKLASLIYVTVPKKRDLNEANTKTERFAFLLNKLTFTDATQLRMLQCSA